MRLSELHAAVIMPPYYVLFDVSFMQLLINVLRNFVYLFYPSLLDDLSISKTNLFYLTVPKQRNITGPVDRYRGKIGLQAVFL